jgi:hypothetical protein
MLLLIAAFLHPPSPPRFGVIRAQIKARKAREESTAPGGANRAAALRAKAQSNRHVGAFRLLCVCVYVCALTRSCTHAHILTLAHALPLTHARDMPPLQALLS